MTKEIQKTQLSSYLQYLPAILQHEEDSTEQDVSFLGRFLLAFENILSGLGDDDAPGFEEKIKEIHAYFDPNATPVEFLSWLAGWVALSLREDWSEVEKRRFISRIVPIYRQRGTKAGLAEVLRTYTGMGVEIREFNQALQIGKISTVGEDTVIGGGSPHYFLVKVVLPDLGDLDFERKKQIARAIIDQEKPAHTYYDLEFEVPTMIVGDRSTVGVDTLLGTGVDR